MSATHMLARAPCVGADEMGNCATTLREGLQCPEGSVFLNSLGYDRMYVWGNAMAPEDDRPTMCIFEAPATRPRSRRAPEHPRALPWIRLPAPPTCIGPLSSRIKHGTPTQDK